MKDHYNSNGCPYCSGKKMNTDLFIKKSKKIHNNFYDYSKVDYKKSLEQVTIFCPIHGSFKQKPNIHLGGHGCPVCKSSRGEKEIIKLLDENNVEYKYQKIFKKCRHILPLPFDFYLPMYNVCIEYNGIQHYKMIEYFGGEDSFKMRKKRDTIKKDFCKNNKIKFRIITYKNNIEKKIIKIRALIHVTRDSQKGIIIGHKGLMLKRVGTEARYDMEDFFRKKVFLELYVKVTKDWRDKPHILKRFGYR
jgi:hypothetical protein